MKLSVAVSFLCLASASAFAPTSVKSRVSTDTRIAFFRHSDLGMYTFRVWSISSSIHTQKVKFGSIECNRISVNSRVIL